MSSKVHLSYCFLFMNLDRSHQRSNFITFSPGWTKTIYFFISLQRRRFYSLNHFSDWRCSLPRQFYLFLIWLIQCKSIFFGLVFRKDGTQKITILCLTISRLNSLSFFSFWNDSYIPTVNHLCSSPLNTVLTPLNCGLHNAFIGEDSVLFFGISCKQNCIFL